MPIFARIRTGEPIVNGLVTVRPRDDGTRDRYGDVPASGLAATRAQLVGTGADSSIQQWTSLANRYLIDPTGWSS